MLPAFRLQTNLV